MRIWSRLNYRGVFEVSYQVPGIQQRITFVLTLVPVYPYMLLHTLVASFQAPDKNDMYNTRYVVYRHLLVHRNRIIHT